ncbi:hypothetical protein HMPREF9382_1457 [Streptococcus sanguinis SK115]|uniref:Uncharacterized protein n=1 Tax=Streptococcus sanguinis SK115 TaxID=888810 RepID=F0I9H3_STRSA|nr:hypothetical protein HMPREF9382_1457 [Streptococcus sanguinis SK115]
MFFLLQISSFLLLSFQKTDQTVFLFYRPSITDTENFVQYFFKKDYF